MAATISAPRSDPEGIDELAALWEELHRHHRDVSDYEPLVRDAGASWASRRRWYHRLLAEGASYVTAADEDGRLVGYAMVAVEAGPDDTFDVQGGIAELVTLVVTGDRRSTGVGRALLRAAEGIARDHGFDTVKIGVMSGNDRAQRFYETNGYALGEHILYRRLDRP